MFPHITIENNVITGTGFKPNFIPETTKLTTQPHKGLKKSKSCIASEASSEFIWEKVHGPYYRIRKIKKKKAMEILKSTSIFSSYKKPFPQRPSTVFIPKSMMWGVPVFIEIG